MKRFWKALISSLILLMLVGCGASGKKEVVLGELKNTEGDFQFSGLAWERSLAEVEEALGCTLSDMGGVDEVREYKVEEPFFWKGMEGVMLCEFVQDKLNTVSIHFTSEEAGQEAFWEDLKSELCVLYGNVDENVQTSTAGDLQITTESVSYLWESASNRHTALSISKLSVNGQFRYIALNVYIVPEKEK